MKRMSLRSTGHAGHRRIFFILDRATRKFHGDIGLWMQYIEYARKQKANKKLSQILTRVLRLHPTNSALWIYTASYALEEKSDMTEARSYMQRALRFCKYSKNLWLEYARLEMMYISRIAARSRVLGRRDISGEDADMDEDVQRLPVIAGSEMDQDVAFDEPIDEGVLTQLNNIPALSGAIPMAIFDAAMKQLNGDNRFGHQFYDMIASFDDVPCLVKVLQHVLDALQATFPADPQTLLRFVKEPTISLRGVSASWPDAMSTSLDRLGSAMDTLSRLQGQKNVAQSRSALGHGTIEWILLYLDADSIDPDIATALFATVKKIWGQYLVDLEEQPGVGADNVLALIEQGRGQGLEMLAAKTITVGSRIWPEDERFNGGFTMQKPSA